MNEIQKALMEMMIDVDRKLRSENIFYFIDSGNALGAIRHKGFIPWDDDIDIRITRKDLKKFIKAIKSMDGYYLQEPFSVDWYHTFYKIRKNNTTAIEDDWKDTRMHQGLFIDVFVVEDYPDSPTARRMYDRLTEVMIQTGEKAYCSKNDVFFKIGHIISKILNTTMDIITGENCEFVTQRDIFKETNTYSKKLIEKTFDVDYENYSLPLPVGYDEMLRMKYGDYMQLPPEEKRQGHHLVFFSKDIDYKEYLSKHDDKC